MTRYRSIRKKSGRLLATAVLVGASLSLAGEMTKSPDARTVLEKKQESNPLSFCDGKIVFDIQERFRWEIRENNFDCNDATDHPTDDNWFLQCARIGLMLKPTTWLKIYAQAQDSREIDSDRPDFPTVLGAE